jgi:hypothetical protein
VDDLRRIAGRQHSGEFGGDLGLRDDHRLDLDLVLRRGELVGHLGGVLGLRTGQVEPLRDRHFAAGCLGRGLGGRLGRLGLRSRGGRRLGRGLGRRRGLL